MRPSLALLLIFAAALVCCNKTPKSPSEWEQVLLDEEDARNSAAAPGSAPATHSPVAPAPELTAAGNYAEVFNDSNYIQYASAERLGIEPIHSIDKAYNTRRPLVKIESCDNFELDNLTHSMPFLVPEAADLLNEIGSDFNAVLAKRGAKGQNKIVVTSALRSPYTVKKLRAVNTNAVDSSTHMFATTFDIAWNKFYTPDASNSLNPEILKRILAEVLLEKRNQGKCYVKYEQKSPCFHITVNR
ncbi:MAG: hypothetical protein J1E97_07685 [Muribaculaceae bacterium]|nr:hypothetical protein [Muribaculaceae bacterium]